MFLRRLLMSLAVLALVVPAAMASPSPGYFYRAHVATLGWLPPVWDGATAGTTGQARQLEAVDFVWLGQRSRAHVANLGWLPELSGPGTIGTTGRGIQLEAIQVTSSIPGQQVECQAHVANLGWLPRVGDGHVCGTTGRGLRAEAFRLWLVPVPIP